MSSLAMPRARSTQLLERENEVAAIASALAAAEAGTGALVIVEGETGIGKTTLLDHAAAVAASRGMLVLRAGGAELEQSDPFGVAAALFAPQLVRRTPNERFGERRSAPVP